MEIVGLNDASPQSTASTPQINNSSLTVMQAV